MNDRSRPCYMCDRSEGHAEHCPRGILNRMIDDAFLHGPGGPPIDVNPSETRKMYEGMRAAVDNHKVIVIVGDSGVPSPSLAALIIGLDHRVQTEAMTVAMLKARGPGDASLVICDASERLGLEEFGMPPALAELRQGRLSAEELGSFERNWDAPPVKTHNRSDNGRHGPHNSFHRKSKKGRK